MSTAFLINNDGENISGGNENTITVILNIIVSKNKS